MNLDAKIEAILYFKNEPLSIKKIAGIAGAEEAEVKEAVNTLEKRLEGGGLALIKNNDELALGTAPEASGLIEKILKDEFSRELGKAAIDTLAIIMYYGPTSKSKIDNIRGVNSGFILRNLMIRGLISRTINENDQRSFLYGPTIELFSHLGIKEIGELPEYNELKQTLQKSLNDLEKKENEGVSGEA